MRLLDDAQVASMHEDVPKLRHFPESQHLDRAWLDNLAAEFEALRMGEAVEAIVPGAGLHYYNLCDLERVARYL